jgi:hypothetical protein
MMEDPTMTSTAQHAAPRTSPRDILVALIAVVVLAAVATLSQLALSARAVPDTQGPVVSDPWAPSRPGGSVYDSQVPEGRAVDPWLSSRPGGSVYESQVP